MRFSTSLHSIVRSLRFAGAVLAGLSLAACTSISQVPPEPLRTAEILEMSRNGVPATDIIAEIEQSRTVYYMNSDDVVRLREAGVDARVIDHMMTTAERAERRARVRSVRRYYYPGPYFGGAYFGGPIFWGPAYCW